MLMQIMMKLMRTYCRRWWWQRKWPDNQNDHDYNHGELFQKPVVEGGGGEEDSQGGEGPKKDAADHVEVGEVSEDSVFLEVSEDSDFDFPADFHRRPFSNQQVGRI